MQQCRGLCSCPTCICPRLLRSNEAPSFPLVCVVLACEPWPGLAPWSNTVVVLDICFRGFASCRGDKSRGHVKQLKYHFSLALRSLPCLACLRAVQCSSQPHTISLCGASSRPKAFIKPSLPPLIIPEREKARREVQREEREGVGCGHTWRVRRSPPQCVPTPTKKQQRRRRP